MAATSASFCNSASPSHDGVFAGAEALKSAHLANFYLRTALDQSEHGVLILQPQWDEMNGPKVLYSNSRMTQMTGADPRKGMRGMFLTQLLASESDLCELLHALLQAARMGGGGQWEGGLCTSFSKEGLKCTWRIRAVQNDFGRVQNYTVTVSPSQSQTHVDAMDGNQEQHLQDQARDAKRLRNDNLATMSQGVLHDLNNLLGIIMTNLSAIRLPADGMNDVQHHVQESLDAAAQARDFTTQTLRMAKDVPLVREPVAVSQIIREATRIAQSGSGVKLHMHVPQDLWWAVADRSQFAQVIQNLVINGIQAMNNTGLMDVSARNVLAQQGHGLLAPGSYVEVVVRDRGCGMSPDLLNRVLHGPFTTKDNGNGIGLSTCRRVIEEHGGRFYISSMTGVGTEVYFWLPATKNLDSTASTTRSKELVQGSGSVLVVDDEDRLRKVIVSVLKQCGYRVYEAPGGEEAIETYRRLMHLGDEVDLVIMDLTLKGGLNGEETMHGIKQLNAQAKIVASSGGLVTETGQSYLNMGFCDILPKPYLAPDVASLVHKHIMKIGMLSEPQAA